GLPRVDDGRGPATLSAQSECTLHRSRRTMLAVIGGSVVVLAVIALILSQTVFRSVLEDPGPTAYPTADRSAEGQSEYVPDPEEPEIAPRSEEHTSELQSRFDLVCRLLLEKKK